MEIRDKELRDTVNKKWKERIDLLNKRKGDDADFLKSWLRARHAIEPTDFEKIGSQFHRWVRECREIVGLKKPQDFASFITRDLDFYSKQFLKLRNAAEEHNVNLGLECVHYLAQHSFTLQYPLLLASLSPDDSTQNIQKKLQVISAYLDILIHRRIGNKNSIAESTMRHIIFNLIPNIRNKEIGEIAKFLCGQLKQDAPRSTLASDFSLHGGNRPRVKRILARITDYVETKSANRTNYAKYFARGKEAFQIEHIWHDTYSKVCQQEHLCGDDSVSEQEFESMRDNIGGLLLLPQKDNASYGACRYAKKRKYYQTQNLLAGSLHENCYESKTGFRQFSEQSGLSFKPHSKFQKKDIEERQLLYRQIADGIWNPDRLLKAAGE